jgi:hypothetical protein
MCKNFKYRTRSLKMMKHKFGLDLVERSCVRLSVKRRCPYWRMSVIRAYKRCLHCGFVAVYIFKAANNLNVLIGGEGKIKINK